MRILWGVLFLSSIVVLAAPPLPSTSAQSSTASTNTGVWGDFRDMEIDLVRQRLYVTDASTFHAQGVAVIDIAARAEVARISIYDPRGIALSPSGTRLAVASSRDVHIVDPETLQELGRIALSNESFAGGAWDLAFFGDERVWVTPAQLPYSVGGTFPVAILSVTTMTVAAWVDEGIDAFSGQSTIEIDSARGRAYILEFEFPSSIHVYDATQTPPVEVQERLGDGNLMPHAVLSPDGTRLFFPSGYVYDALTLTPIASGDGNGEVALDASRSYVYYAHGPFLDRRSWTNLSLLSQFAFGGSLPWDDHVKVSLIDSPRNVAYVIGADALNSETVHAVPLVPAILDPYPEEGGLISGEFRGISAVLSGGVDPSSVQLVLDNQTHAVQYDLATSVIYTVYPFPEPLADGAHTAVLIARDSAARELRLEWTFTLDSKEPEIHFENAGEIYRVPNVTVRGRIVDAHLDRAQANGQPLTVDPATGAFEVPMTLSEGGNSLWIEAWDLGGLSKWAIATILYVPPTTQYIDKDARFSIEYPSSWIAQQDVVIAQERFEVVLEAAGSGGVVTNLNVLVASPPSEYTETALLLAAGQALEKLGDLPSLVIIEGPQAVELPRSVAATYTISWTVQDGETVQPLFQRQYIIASPEARRAWVLTFTTDLPNMTRYDPLFRWMAESLRPRQGFSLDAPVLLAVVGAATGTAGVCAFYLLRRSKPSGRQRQSSVIPQPSQPISGPRNGTSPETAPSLPEPPPKEPPLS